MRRGFVVTRFGAVLRAWPAAGALLVGCNGVLGLGGDYYLVSDGDDANGAAGGKKMVAGAGGRGLDAGRGGSSAAGTDGATAAAGDAGASAGNGGSEAGRRGTGGSKGGGAGRGANGGSTNRGSANGGSTNGGSTNGGEGGAAGEAGSTDSSGGMGGHGGSHAGSGGTLGGGGMTGSSGAVGRGGTTGSGANGGTVGNGGNAATAGAGAGGAASGTGGSNGGNQSVAGAGGSGGSGGTSAVVALTQVEQTIEGFGINDTWGQAFSSPVADMLFTTTPASGVGLGLTMLRVGMSDQGTDSNSFESTNITAATARGARLIGSCWSPPANCKTNSSVDDGGHLLASCYDSWSTEIVNWAKGHHLYAMSIANAPDFAACGASDPCDGDYPSTLYTANEMVAWVKAAGPKLQAAGIKVIAPEVREWNHLWSNTSAGPDVNGKNSSDPLNCGFPPTSSVCATGGGYDYGHALAKDTTAWSAFDIVGVHEYDSEVASAWPSDVTATKKEVWQTEMAGVKWWPEQGPSSDIANGVAVAGWIHSALTTGNASAWFWWWYQAYNIDDNEGLLLKSGTSTKRYYTLANYSVFVRPGYERVDVTGPVPAGVLLSAYKGTGVIVIVAINQNGAPASVPITIAGGAVPGSSFVPWVTSSTDNFAPKSAVSVSGGSFTAVLGATSVTTFVAQ